MSEKAFTLLELLLVIAIISVLGSVVVFNLRPADSLNSAIRSRSKAHAEEIEKAINAYITDNGGNLPASLAALPAGLYDICKQDSVACPGGAISLDSLISAGYLSYIAQTSDQQGSELSGYKVSKGSNGQVSVRKYTSAISDISSVIEDGYIQDNGSKDRFNTGNSIDANQSVAYGLGERMGYIKFSLVSVSPSWEITSVNFVYHGWNDGGNPPTLGTTIVDLTGVDPSITSNGDLYNAIDLGTVYETTPIKILGGTQREVSLGTRGVNNIVNSISLGWFAIGIESQLPIQISASEYTSANPKPTLRITYSYPE